MCRLDWYNGQVWLQAELCKTAFRNQVLPSHRFLWRLSTLVLVVLFKWCLKNDFENTPFFHNVPRSSYCSSCFCQSAVRFWARMNDSRRERKGERETETDKQRQKERQRRWTNRDSERQAGREKQRVTETETDRDRDEEKHLRARKSLCSWCEAGGQGPSMPRREVTAEWGWPCSLGEVRSAARWRVRLLPRGTCRLALVESKMTIDA